MINEGVSSSYRGQDELRKGGRKRRRAREHHLEKGRRDQEARANVTGPPPSIPSFPLRTSPSPPPGKLAFHLTGTLIQGQQPHQLEASPNTCSASFPLKQCPPRRLLRRRKRVTRQSFYPARHTPPTLLTFRIIPFSLPSHITTPFLSCNTHSLPFPISPTIPISPATINDERRIG